MPRERIDKLLVERGLADSRTKAQALVMAGAVLVDEQLIHKPSEVFSHDANIRIKESATQRYVSRGGIKLEAALREFNVGVCGLVCLDIGASTGGFTDCLLQHGARRVVALDVGHNQLDWKIRNDSRVEVREAVNARHLTAEDFDEKFDLVTIDISFISLTKIFPAVVSLPKREGHIIALIKPQFEVGKGEVGKGGIVRDAQQHLRVISEVNAAAESLGLKVDGIIESPIEGADGNIEFLALYSSPGHNHQDSKSQS
jgi:23S rRNA (cytidine1920-2'-O)/16S rRNA (cytidine1409-2'-O)-methyltransferase